MGLGSKQLFRRVIDAVRNGMVRAPENSSPSTGQTAWWDSQVESGLQGRSGGPFLRSLHLTACSQTLRL